MATVTDASDAVIVFQNDVADAICRKLLHIKSPSFDEMNDVLSQHLAMVMLPAMDEKLGREALLADLMHLCSHPVS